VNGTACQVPVHHENAIYLSLTFSNEPCSESCHHYSYYNGVTVRACRITSFHTELLCTRKHDATTVAELNRFAFFFRLFLSEI